MVNRIFAGCFPTGVSYADREREEDGDYKRLAFLPYTTLVLAFQPDCPAWARAEIEADAATLQARAGEAYQVTTCGQTVLLGSVAAARRKLGFGTTVQVGCPTIDTAPDGRFFIRTAAGNVARQSNCEPFYIDTRERAEAACAYLAMPYAERKRAAHWLKSTFGLEG